MPTKPIQNVTLKMDFARLRNRLFKYDSSKADERYFKNGISEWLITPPAKRPTFYQLLYKMVQARNSGGTLKYAYFNDHQQRVYLKHDFETWANKITLEIAALLKIVHGGQ